MLTEIAVERKRQVSEEARRSVAEILLRKKSGHERAAATGVFAEEHGVSERTIRNWVRAARPGAIPARPPGRPRLSEDVAARAMRAVSSAMTNTIPRPIGEPALKRQHGHIPTRALRAALKIVKAECAARAREHARENRMCIDVHKADAVWGLDATHVGRTDTGRAIEAEVTRDIATGAWLTTRVGRKSNADDVLGHLALLQRDHGVLPLVLQTDNGSAYTARKVTQWLAEHKVIHLRSLRRTPQHNPVVERGNRTLKDRARVGKGYLVHDMAALRDNIEHTRIDLNATLRQRTRNNLTPDALGCTMPNAMDDISRDDFYAACVDRVRAATEQVKTTRQRCKAEREAIYQTMEDFKLLTRTRGGLPITRCNSETVT
jgi:transposase InsO family protein